MAVTIISEIFSLILGVNLLSREGNSQTGHRMFRFHAIFIALFLRFLIIISYAKGLRFQKKKNPWEGEFTVEKERQLPGG